MPETVARRNVLGAIATNPTTAHPGLLLDRYCEKLDDDGSAAKRKIQETAAAQAPAPAYKLAYGRWLASVDGAVKSGRAIAVAKDLSVQGRLVTGLGAASPLEAGLCLHHTYGVPWLPGSGLKGLAAHYCSQVWGERDSRFKADMENYKNHGEFFRTMFGDTKQAGTLVFHDGWWVPGSADKALLMDVMTPHHGDYYMAKQDTATDFDDPVPVSFLSIHGKFTVAVECRREPDQLAQAKNWAKLGLELLTEALAEWGFGGKSSSGYGRIGAVTHGLATGDAKSAGDAATTPATSDFTKQGDTTIGVVKSDKGQYTVEITINGKPEVVSMKKRNVHVGQKILVKAVNWPRGKPKPDLVDLQSLII